MRILFAMFSIFFVFYLNLESAAQSGKAHITHYQAYNSAIEAGDLATAVQEGKAAWRAAEMELGDNQITAILAYNYASLIYNIQPKNAVEALLRVVELTGEANDLFGPEAPVVMLRLSEAYAQPESRDAKTTLRKTLEDLPSPNNEKTLLYARAWFHIGTYELSRNRYNRAVKALDYSVDQFNDFREIAAREVAAALLSGGVARIAGSRRSNDDVEEAYAFFGDATQLFPPQKSISEFDRLLATAIAWSAATRAAASTDYSLQSSLGTRVTKSFPDLPATELVKWQTPRPRYGECNFQWAERKPPKYSSSDANRGFIGGVIIGYDVEGTEIKNAVLLSEVPQQSDFGERALKSVDDWRLEAPVAPACEKNNLTHFVFSIRN